MTQTKTINKEIVDINDKRNKTVDATVTRKRKLIALTRREGGFPLVSNDKDRDTLCKIGFG